MWPERNTISAEDGSPKIHRHYLFGTGKTFGVFLHHFVGNDAPTKFHDHPWSCFGPRGDDTAPEPSLGEQRVREQAL